ncbi:hypothetical protein L861_19915 [Litchfieldella anticariensis FP35 = DSM 16096]|uniref:Cytoskeleton protein RodZ-like C-terminal domain-containing protein n=1 Tax=Litchfieldella anticariensis (strain DSM 16096 / CECT 5854 / CIP 108499 / LMG 22089 / FP35) TaxID=1121939 RepID=S2L2L5_LITA3|nr:RodZ domain-containing protein [Halomonas anticariensis]EPC01919.1 hypothetical protein L861_19915 [Halomonas anticariensis FP35 = DSM 16096]
MSETHYNDPAELAPQPSPGELLKLEREKQGLSREEVATALNLRPAVVDGLESDSYDEVPVATYRRGYLRAYSRLLGIDDRPIIDAYNSRFGNVETEHRIAPVHVTKPPSRIGAWLFKLVTLLVIAGLIGLTLLWWQSRNGNDLLGLGGNEPVAVDTLDGTPVAEQPAESTSEQTESASESLPPLPEDSEELGLVDDATDDPAFAPDTATDSNIGDVPAPQADVETPGTDDGEDRSTSTQSASPEEPIAGEEASEPSTAETQEQEPTASATDSRTLQLTFNEQSWTEIFDANNDRIFVGLQEGGTQATAEGEPPFRLTIGNASGVELRYRGEVIDLRERAGTNNVARFTLGE